jgi:hypothetical protein
MSKGSENNGGLLVYPKTASFDGPLPVFELQKVEGLTLAVLPFCLKSRRLAVPNGPNNGSWSTAATFYVFAAGLGFTWLATVPPTAAIVAKLFGIRYLATLFGLTLLSHQIGGFFGAYLGASP